MNSIRASYKIDRSYAGLILGKKGRGLDALREIGGVHGLFLDRRQTTCTLRVSGARRECCDAVYHEVMRRINNFIASSQTNRFLIDAEDRSLDTCILEKCGNPGNSQSVVVGHGKKTYDEYVVTSIIRGTPCNGPGDVDEVNDVSTDKSGFMELNAHNVVNSMQGALDDRAVRGIGDDKLHFHVSVGKLTFTAPTYSRERYLERNQLTSSSGRDYLTRKSMGTFFNPNIGTRYVADVCTKMSLLDFTLMEDDAEGDVSINLDDGGKGWTNVSIELGKTNTTSKRRPVKIVKNRRRMRSMSTLSANKVDISACLTSYREQESEMTVGESRALQMCWDDWEAVSQFIPLGGKDSNENTNSLSVSCVKQVLDTYTWEKEIPFENCEGDSTILTVRMKKLRKKSQKFGVRDNCVEMNLYLALDRANCSGEDLMAEMMELKKWVQCILE